MSFFLSFLAGVVLCYSFRYFPSAAVLIFLLSSVLLLFKKRYFPIAVILFGAVFAFLRYGSESDVPYTRDHIAVKGIFESYPVRTDTGNFRQAFTAESAVNLRTGEKFTELYGKEIVLFSDREFDPGTGCDLAIKILKSRQRLNPGEPVWENAYANLLDMRHTEAKRISLYSWIQNCRYRINRYIEENLKEDSGAFVSSITTGETANMSEELKEAFNVTGLAHILSISGSHFGLFSVFLFGIFRFVIKALPYKFLQRVTIYVTPSQAAAVLCLPFMLAYLGLSGASVPAIRSFIMIGLFLLGLIIGKKGFWLNSLLFAAFLIVAWQPESILNLSFQLSFIAVLFIGFSVQHAEDNKKGGCKLIRYFRNSLLMTLSASIGTAPLVAYHFHYFSVISPLSNLIAAPLIGFLLIPLSVVSCFLFLITGHFVFTDFVSLFSDLSIASVKLLAGIPFASIGIPAFPAVLLILFYAGFTVYFLRNERHRRSKEVGQFGSTALPGKGDIASTANNITCKASRLSFPQAKRIGNPSENKERFRTSRNDSPETGCGLSNDGLSNVNCWDSQISCRGRVIKKYLRSCLLMTPFVPFAVYVSMTAFERNGLTVTFLDVGQGDSAVVEFPDGKTMVIDTGRTGRETASFLKYGGKRTVDVLALSHVHPDHTGGLDAISRKFYVREIWDNGRIAYPDNVDSKPVQRGDMIEGRGYKVYVLHPYPEFYTLEKSEYLSANNDSLVLRIEGDKLSFLFTGDIEEEAEENILHLGKWLKSDVIKVPHHGGRSSAYDPFFMAVSPDVAVISAGRDNSFGHPHQETLDAFQRTHICRTDIDGAIKISESNKGVEIKTYKEFQLKEAKSLSEEMRNLKLLAETW